MYFTQYLVRIACQTPCQPSVEQRSPGPNSSAGWNDMRLAASLMCARSRTRQPCDNQAPMRAGLNRSGHIYPGDRLGSHVIGQAARYPHRITLPDLRDAISEAVAVARRCRPALLCAESDSLD